MRTLLRPKKAIALATACFFAFSLEAIEAPVGVAASGWLTLGMSKAHARGGRHVRRGVRRTSRRTTRRVVRRSSIAGCTPWNSYYSCGGVYYRPIVENGVTVYIVVNP